MIKYSLRCDQHHEFEGWFRNSSDCDDQIASGHVECPLCGSVHVSKTLMAPRVTGTRSQDRPQPTKQQSSSAHPTSATSVQPVANGGAVASQPDPQQIQQMLRAFRDHVVQNADYVGSNFAEEARKMHYKEAEPRGIYGEATTEEVKSLTEDGIDCLPLPVLPEDQN